MLHTSRPLAWSVEEVSEVGKKNSGCARNDRESRHFQVEVVGGMVGGLEGDERANQSQSPALGVNWT